MTARRLVPTTRKFHFNDRFAAADAKLTFSFSRYLFTDNFRNVSSLFLPFSLLLLFSSQLLTLLILFLVLSLLLFIVLIIIFLLLFLVYLFYLYCPILFIVCIDVCINLLVGLQFEGFIPERIFI